MSVLEIMVACVALVAIALYAIFGGADFGAGVWSIVASGPRRDEQREAIEHAIGPVWETNHVWLIFLIVTLFTCFPPAFADISVGLFVPLTLVLVGIILRGAAYAFRASGAASRTLTAFWSGVFGVASSLAPFFFGSAVGGLTVGDYAWTSPFALCVGLIAITLCAQIAAILLTLETNGALQNDFRTRATIATFALAATGALALAVARATSPATFVTLMRPQALPGIGVAMLLGFCVLGSLFACRFHLARIAVGCEVVAVLAGWYASQAPYLIRGVLTVSEGAAPPRVLLAFLWLTAAGTVCLVPSLALLFSIFKRTKA